VHEEQLNDEQQILAPRAEIPPAPSLRDQLASPRAKKHRTKQQLPGFTRLS
jgi:hypothetical protein